MLLCGLEPALFAQAPGKTTSGMRLIEGKPNLTGIWQVLNSAAWDIQDHTGQLGIPPGQGVVDGNELPYQPWAAKKKEENAAQRKTADPTESNCFLPGVPRANDHRNPVPRGVVDGKSQRGRSGNPAVLARMMNKRYA